MNKIPIIAFAPHPWKESEWMNRQQLLSRLGKRGWPVVYSTGALDIWQRNGEQWQTAPLAGQTEASDHVALFHAGKLFPRWRKFPSYDRWAIEHHAKRLKRAAGLKANDTDFIALPFNPVFWPYVEALNPRFVAFHIYDAFSKMLAWDKALEANYHALLERADLVAAASEAMAEDAPSRFHGKIKILHNGVDTELFDDKKQHACPADLAAIPSPRIANTGNTNRKIDLKLIVEIAQRKPEWNWVFIGKVDHEGLKSEPELAVALEQCESLPNVYFLGEKNRLEIPAYSGNMDVNVICYRIEQGNWAAAGYPLKLNEYLAVGKPVVSSPIEAVKTHFSDCVAIAETTDDWIAAIEQALTQGGVGSPALRQTIARQNSWDNRVDQLEQWLHELIQAV